MKDLRFSVGEIAVYVVPNSQLGMGYVGAVVVVIGVGPWEPGEIFGIGGEVNEAGGRRDYCIELPDRRCGLVNDWQLRKLDPLAESEGLLRNTDVCEEAIA